MIDLWPKTGRTHQLRKHLAAVGYPILGDERYGPEAERRKGGGGSGKRPREDEAGEEGEEERGETGPEGKRRGPPEEVDEALGTETPSGRVEGSAPPPAASPPTEDASAPSPVPSSAPLSTEGASAPSLLPSSSPPEGGEDCIGHHPPAVANDLLISPDLHLWALEIAFPHPATGETLRVSVPDPPEVRAILIKENEQRQRVGES